MPRAKRYSQSGLVWRITHRCHRQRFLLEFWRDRVSWRRGLFAARKRQGLCVPNYIATFNRPVSALAWTLGAAWISYTFIRRDKKMGWIPLWPSAKLGSELG